MTRTQYRNYTISMACHWFFAKMSWNQRVSDYTVRWFHEIFCQVRVNFAFFHTTICALQSTYINSIFTLFFVALLSRNFCHIDEILLIRKFCMSIIRLSINLTKIEMKQSRQSLRKTWHRYSGQAAEQLTSFASRKRFILTDVVSSDFSTFRWWTFNTILKMTL